MENQGHEPIKILNLIIRFKNAFFTMWPIILVLALLLGAYTWYTSKRAFVPMYESKAIFTVDSGYEAEDIFGAGSYYDQYAAQHMVSAFPHLISTDMMRDLIVEELDKGYINGQASATAVADSNMMVLSVIGSNPQDAYDYLCAIIKFYPQIASTMVDTPQIKMVTSPEVAKAPYNSFNDLLAVLKGIFLGVALGLLIIFVCSVLARTIQTTDELKTAVNIPLLVALPKVTPKKRRSKSSNLITADSDANMTESFRGLRMKIKKLMEDSKQKTLLVTSTLAGEGKTTIAINIALSLAQEDHKVLILDADLRSQSVARCLGEKNHNLGLMDCLKERDMSVFDCVRKSETYGVDFISGRSTDKRHYSLNADRLKAILRQLSEEYDYVIIDTPPQDVVSDSAVLCRCADCVLYVVKQDYVQKAQILNAITAMHQKDITISGCIFNGVPRFHRHYGYGYRSGYGYGYDYGYRKNGYRYGYGYGYRKNYGYRKDAKKETSSTET